MKKLLLVSALMVLGFAGTASAAGATFGTPPPSSVIVVRGGLEWIWAAPCASEVPSCGAPTPMFGFHVPTASEWTSSFVDLADLVAAFTVPSLRCGSPWMSSVHDHCDPGDAASGFVWHSPFAPDAFHSDNSASEGFYVRGAQDTVPEPASLVLLGTGILGIAAAARRRVKSKV